MAERKIERIEYESWEAEYDEAKKCLLDNRAESISRLQESLEKKLMLIGATAIQDKLQEGVEDTIQGMKAAGINVWVLTGDKIETAINIGYACGLLDNSMHNFVIEEKSENELEKSFEKCLTKIENVYWFFKSEFNLFVAGSRQQRIDHPRRLSHSHSDQAFSL